MSTGPLKVRFQGGPLDGKTAERTDLTPIGVQFAPQLGFGVEVEEPFFFTYEKAAVDGSGTFIFRMSGDLEKEKKDANTG